MNRRPGMGIGGQFAKLLRLGLICLAFWPFGLAHAQFAPPFDTAEGFFTNVAARLLRSECGRDLNAIQIYPTNQYTPPVHRLLQLTANLYDATTNRSTLTDYPYLPTVFRPLFRRVTTGSTNLVFIAGYREVTNADLAYASTAPPMVDLFSGNLPDISNIPVLGTPFLFPERDEPMVRGYPLIIGAKKGFPNFNEMAVETHAQVTRELEFRRPPLSHNPPVNETNQMYILSISNCLLGFEAWNSYATNFPRPLDIQAAAVLTMAMTNAYGTLIASNSTVALMFTNTTQFPSGSWPGAGLVGYALYPAAASFLVPAGLNTSFYQFGLHAYSDTKKQFEAAFPTPFERHPGVSLFSIPDWHLSLRTELLFAIVDTNANRLVDYVNLDSYVDPAQREYFNFSDILQEGATCDSPSVNGAGIPDGSYFCTNRYPSGSSLATPTVGIINQILTCWGHTTPISGHGGWTYVPGIPANVASAIDYFKDQFGLGIGVYATTNVFYAPYSPTRDIYFPISWQVNDPLVHYTTAEMSLKTNRYATPSDLITDLARDAYTKASIGKANVRFSPWSVVVPANQGLQDPGVRGSEYWSFSTDTSHIFQWLGQVHRGTPWQTIYLKSLVAASNSWFTWVGSYDLPGQPSASQRVHPTNDWHIATELARMLRPVSFANLKAVNQPNSGAWAALMDGMVAYTNAAGASLVSEIMFSNSPQAGVISAALDDLRQKQPGQVFRTVEAILAAPELSTATPWLNPTNTQASRASLNDAAYETLPWQLLELLRPDSIGSLTLGSGQNQLQFSGIDGFQYAIEGTSDLTNWTTIATASATNGTVTISEPANPAGTPRFYRSRLRP